AAELVTAEQERRAFREEQRGEEVPLLPRPQGDHIWIITRSLDAAVPTAVVIAAVMIVLAVGLVVLGVVADEVGEGEAVMNGHDVDRRHRPPSAVSEQV